MAGKPAEIGRIMVVRLVTAAESNDPPGLTCDEMEVLSGGKHQTVSARVRECVLARQIHDSGKRRKTRSGSWANVYRLGPDITAAAPVDAEATLF